MLRYYTGTHDILYTGRRLNFAIMALKYGYMNFFVFFYFGLYCCTGGQYNWGSDLKGLKRHFIIIFILFHLERITEVQQVRRQQPTQSSLLGKEDFHPSKMTEPVHDLDHESLLSSFLRAHKAGVDRLKRRPAGLVCRALGFRFSPHFSLLSACARGH